MYFCLFIDLKRFSGERYRSRLSTLVDFPLTKLDLSPYAAMKSGMSHGWKNFSVTANFTFFCSRNADLRLVCG